jgi:cell division protein FtsB
VVNPDTIYAQYGAIGLVAALSVWAVRIMYGKLQAAYEREKERADRLEDELRRLNDMIRTDYVSTISRASQAMSEANRAVADALAAVRRTQ